MNKIKKYLLNKKWFRLYYYNQLLKYIDYKINQQECAFLCYFRIYNKLLGTIFCWTEFKEIQDNKDSNLVYKVRCSSGPEFNTNENRRLFIQECIKLLHKSDR